MQLRPVVKWTAVVGGLLFLLAVVILAAGLTWLRGSLPDYDGERAIAGLSGPVEVLRDENGLVTIRAGDERDAARALGYVHAQDRLGQMDLMRRAGAGRLAEILGRDALGHDRLMRTLGLYRQAEAAVEALPAETRALLEAYAQGVNALQAEPGHRLPPEFHLLGYQPAPWQARDSLLWGALMALQLSNNWRDEAARFLLAQRLTPDQIEALWPRYPADGPITIGALRGKPQKAGPRPDEDRAAAPIPARRQTAGREISWDPLSMLAPGWAARDASNVWALSGERTIEGAPILANDPHLGLDAPGQWYLVRIETPGGLLVGATTPGVPFLILGHNGRIAWGFTTTHADTQDLFLERVDPETSDRYDSPSGPQPFIKRQETIDISDGSSEVLEVRETRHGPVVSDLSPELAQALPDGQVLALAWSALAPNDRSAEAIYRLNRAANWSEFLTAMALFHSPVQNVAYADVEGHIGFLVAGRIPRRRQGDGRQPVAGWSGAFDWQGFLPFDSLPRGSDPVSGQIVNANNRVVGDGYRHLITADWADPHRAARIEAVLAQQPRSRLEDSLALQQDLVSNGAKQLLPPLLEALMQVPARHPKAEIARQLSTDWDLRMGREQAAPLIYEAWTTELTRRLLSDELGLGFPRFSGSSSGRLNQILKTAPQWCDDSTTTAAEGCAQQVAAALDDALAKLTEAFGDDPGDWRWGQAHVAPLAHPLLQYLPLFERLFGFALESDGGFTTVNRGTPRGRGTYRQRFQHVHGAGLRAVYDMGDLDNSRFMIATGQSGNPLSALYGSFAERWRDGHYIKLVGPGKESAHRLTLNPQ